MARASRPAPSSGPGDRSATADWRMYRPAIWLVMLGIAFLLVIYVPLGLAVIGAGLGVGFRIESRRRRLARAGSGTVRTRRR